MFWHKILKTRRPKLRRTVISAALLLLLPACGTTSEPGLTTYVGVDQPVPTCEITIDPRVRQKPTLGLLAAQTPNNHNQIEALADKAISDVELLSDAFDTLDAAITADKETCAKEKAALAKERAAVLAKIAKLNAGGALPEDPPQTKE